jgi:AcrR family transcriptional regulator
LDSEGVEKLSMRSLARALGTGSSTLYWHVCDKDELLRLILDETLGGVTVPEVGDWDARLLGTLVRCHDALKSRPALVDVLWRAAWQLGPETLRLADALIGLVAESGLPDEEVADSYMALLTLVFGFVAGEQSSPGNPRYSEVHAARRDDATTGAGGRYPNLTRYGPGAGADALARQFRYAIERFVAGIRVRVAEHEHAAQSRRGSRRRQGTRNTGSQRTTVSRRG